MALANRASKRGGEVLPLRPDFLTFVFGDIIKIEAIIKLIKSYMQIHIRANNMELTPAIRSYAEKKVQGLEKYAPKEPNMPDMQVWVELGVTTKHQSGDIFRAEIQFQIPHEAKMIRAESQTSDMYAAIDEAHEEMKLELQKIKDKKVSSLRRGLGSIKNLFSKSKGE
jgi:putative sigma-54 modulation protein